MSQDSPPFGISSLRPSLHGNPGICIGRDGETRIPRTGPGEETGPERDSQTGSQRDAETGS